MTAIAAGGSSGGRDFAPFHKADRGFFLAMTALIWLGILGGFGSDIVRHINAHEAAYPLIVHVHAAAFVGWLALFTVQVGLIRAGQSALHRRLGLFAIALAAAMIVLGPATAVVVDARKYVATHEAPTFISVQLNDIVVFTLLTGSALLFRRTPAIHKRLMLLSLVQISDAGFARWWGDAAEGLLGRAYFGEFVAMYAGPDLLLLGFGAYDLATRGRLHPAYLAGAAVILAGQLTAIWLWLSPFWAGVSTHLIGK